MLEDVEVFARHYVVHEREDGLIHLRVTDTGTGAHHHVQFPEPTYDLDADANAEFETDAYRLRYQSLVTPASVFDYDIAGQRLRLLKQAEVLGGYDATRYRSERVYAITHDGTRVPISLVRRADAARDGSAPMLLAGYGAYGYPYPAGFSSNRLSLLDRGVSVAIAHIRGGGELGKRWHDEGRMMAKRNTFTDFVAAADHLVKDGYTAVDRLVIEGGSAGGLLMGAVLNLRPDCAAAAVLRVPFVDVINTMLDESLPLTVGEFEEWGNPKIREQYEYMKTYCPYTNLDARRYPALLVKTSLHDSQVMYWEPAKWVARLRALGGPRVPPLFKINMAAGHGGASGRYDYLREIAFDYAFILTRLAPFLLPSSTSTLAPEGGGGRGGGRGERAGRLRKAAPPASAPTSPPDLAPAFLAHLRAELHAPDLTYAAAPTALSGGFDTSIFAFRLSGGPDAAWSGALILRVMNPAHDPLRALRERAIQNTLAAQGYPVPRVLTACADRAPLGAGFLVMERAPGRPLLDDRALGVSATLADAQARLHALDPGPLLRALDDEGRASGGGFDRGVVGYEGYLAALDRRIRRAQLIGLAPGLRWLRDHRPAGGPRVICHGDFHPQNLLAERGRVTAVLDWPNTLVAEPECDVAATLVILKLTPTEVLPVPAALRPLVALLRPIMTRRYLARYRRARALDRARLAYYEAGACMRGLVRAAEARVAGDTNPLDTSSFGERLAARFERVSGVPVGLPPARG